MNTAQSGRHIADHRTPSQGGRARNFLRIARQDVQALQALWRRPAPATNRRVVEFLRIARGRTV